MPPDYIMQGMIADTGGQWQLYKHHHTLTMISDWIFHPFRHLEGGPMAGHHGLMPGRGNPGYENGMMRMIFLQIETGKKPSGSFGLFGMNVRRTPLFVADVEIHSLILLKIRVLPPETGWGRVPTPCFKRMLPLLRFFYQIIKILKQNIKKILTLKHRRSRVKQKKIGYRFMGICR